MCVHIVCTLGLFVGVWAHIQFVCVFRFLCMNVHLCVFIFVCLAQGFNIKPYLCVQKSKVEFSQ